MATIDSTLTLPCGVVLKNRIAKAAMSENLAERDHSPGQKFDVLYDKWAKGGAGLVISGNIMIDSRALGEPGNVVVEPGIEHGTRLSQWAKAGTSHGTALWGQLNHPGKQTPRFLCADPVAPSAIPYPAPMNRLFATPRELRESEIYDLIARFAHGAATLKKCGFSGVQIHGAHGYLVSQFLSPHHNQRKDAWGGNLVQRMRFVMEVYHAIRAQVGSAFPVGIKLNSADFMRGGFSEDESMHVVEVLSRSGIDLIEVSGGTYEAAVMMGKGQKVKASTSGREAYFLDYCDKVAKLTSVPLMLTGGFHSRKAMDAALASGACQMIGLARSMAVWPDFPSKLLVDANCESPVYQLTTGFKALDAIFPLEITWYTQQLHRLACGKDINPHASVKMSILKSIMTYGVQSFRRPRASAPS